MKEDNSSQKTEKIIISLLCGGPSLERGISLNSARSVMDHLQSNQIEIRPVYFNQKREAFVLSQAQLYSNTPADFDFKLSQTAQPLSDAQLQLQLQKSDIVFPVMHGSFGEDGTIQKWLEDRAIPFVGSSSEACKKAFDKFRANEYIASHGFYTKPSCLLRIFKQQDNQQVTEDFFATHGIQRAIVKPASGGSSIGVFSVTSVEEAVEKAELIFSKRMDTRVVIEPFVEGREFTVVLLQNRFGLPVAILPTEIETDYTENQVFDFRKKYLPTRQVTYHCPPRFDDSTINRIQLQSEQLFALLGMRDFARFDGWVLEDGSIWFSDFNPISGMEQNSFLFQQAARVGMSHKAVLEHIVGVACNRHGIKHPLTFEPVNAVYKNKIPLAVIMGGTTSERQVSLMSGTNVWLKLRNSEVYRPIPYLMDSDESLWRVPYQLLLNHTVEEIIENCKNAQLHEKRVTQFEQIARERLGITSTPSVEDFGEPEHITLSELMCRHKAVFIALHGGIGEDGTLQSLFEANNVRFNGPSAAISKLCMDKQATAEAVGRLFLPKVNAITGTTCDISALTQQVMLNPSGSSSLWIELLNQMGARTLVAKPVADGCSSGVVHLYDALDLALYIQSLTSGTGFVPPNSFRGQTERLELPSHVPDAIRFEKYMQTDTIRVKNGQLRHVRKSGLVEITIGVFQQAGSMHAYNPSITIADGEVLSVEEKFQGGTGINLTPPPVEIMSTAVCRTVKKNIEKLATDLGLTGYSRIDAFVAIDSGELHIIEINSLPGLTPSTVIFQQALAESPAVYPMKFLEQIANNKYQDSMPE